MRQLKAYILFPHAEKSAIYRDWKDQLPIPAVVVENYDTNWNPPDDAGIVITHLHYRWEETTIMRRIVETGRVPLLVLADGILEFRNTFQHPDLPDGSVFMPIMGHKLACIGRSQARLIEAWGGIGKCEVIGLPGLDGQLPPQTNVDRNTDGPFRLLVASANTPYFDQAQKQRTIQSFLDLRDWLDPNATVAGRPIDVSWRLSEALHDQIGVGQWARRRDPIQQIFDKTDAVITTPSTLQLEAAVAGLPVALLDYDHSPQFVPQAWTVSAADHLPRVIAELASPPPAKMMIQKLMLADSLQCDSPATPRLIQLITEMITIGEDCRQQNEPLRFPPRIIADEDWGFVRVEATASLDRLFPDNAAFADSDLHRLQSELSQAVKQMGNYPAKFFEQRNANRKLRGYIDWLRTVVRNRAATLTEMTEKYHRLLNEVGQRPTKKQ